ADALLRGGAELYAFMSNKNPGIYRYCRAYELGKVTDVTAVKSFAAKVKPDIAVVGPEAPLAASVVDELQSIGVKCFGPAKELAQLESSKAFTRQLLERHRIGASPEFRVFDRSSSETELRDFLEEIGEYVIKPDGLTGGKGVRVSGEHISSADEALRYCKEAFELHGSVIIEEKLEGEEFSLQSITDGTTVIDCPAVQDHKRAFENDTGPNTGGMGSYSDANHLLPFLKKEHIEQAHEVTVKVAAALKKEIGEYKGVMYGGFMLTKKGVKLIEYNARFGDPEAMNVLPLLKTNFAEMCMAAANGELHKIRAEFERKATVCKYVVPSGYPDNPQQGKIEMPNYEEKEIKALKEIRALTFYAAVDEKSDGLYTTKSRAVAFVGIAESIEAAEKIAEEASGKVKGAVYHRKDIGTAKLIQKRVEHMKGLG
ncbi:phosphoribosylamine--glycine ligase, partial [Candidatus Woesearchaeota archaeon]|nr:phosphoribosylamine--glycine ligase [Candidatus Woesearchaeota archaeon]